MGLGHRMNYVDFKEAYIDNLDGYLPTYISADEQYEGDDDLLCIDVEMIAPWRMTDGPSKFFRVITLEINRDQYEEVKKYAIAAGEQWKKDLVENVDNCLKYTRSKF